MKRIFSIFLVGFAVVSANAQTMYDAITLGTNDYFGTARSMSLNNAVTALGGDLGMIGINPAGAAVAPYSQFVITPGITVSTTNASYTPEWGGNYTFANKVSKSRFIVPNVGASASFRTGNRSGLKGVTFSFVANSTNQFLSWGGVSGVNDRTSLAMSFANTANYDSDGNNHQLDPDVFQHFSNPWDDSSYGWNSLAGYKSNLFSYNDPMQKFFGVTEDEDGNLRGPLNQTSVTQVYGSKTDIVTGLAFNFNDKFYIGANIGIPTQNYTYDEQFSEQAKEMEQFPVKLGTQGKFTTTYFDSSDYEYYYTANIDGIYAKIGAIYLPTPGLRLGVALQSPTLYTITERWETVISTKFQNSAVNATASSPRGEYRYCFVSPYIVNAGAAFTLGTMGLVSADYELTDYSIMHYSELHDISTYYNAVNEDIRNYCGVSHQFRLGLEANLSQTIALRAGYALRTSPERFYNAEGWSYDKSLNVNSFSAGIGYASRKAFFVDAAARLTKYPVEHFEPYAQYYSTVASPDIAKDRHRLDILLTFGWRF